MTTIKPISVSSSKTSPDNPMTAAEMGKLRATYLGNSMSKCIISYYLQHVEDEDIKTLLENALTIVVDFMQSIETLFNKENFPLPKGFGEEDVNLNAPRLFEDEFYVHYLKYTAKAGMSIYSVAIPLVFRDDIKEFFVNSMKSTIELMEQIKALLMAKGFIIKPPIVPVPEKVEYVDYKFTNGYLGEVRPLHALEITHFYDNIENSITSKALVMAFSQVAKDEEIRELFKKGTDITSTNIEKYRKKLEDQNLPAPSLIDHLVTESAIPPFSDKIMLFHKMDMFSMKIRAIGNSIAVDGRNDISLLYSGAFMRVSDFAKEALKLYIQNGWMEKPILAIDR
ncbi:hypothetical protein GCM10008967_37980 [Bacillus carboniphilus]|uniref:DUF3231 family protein n=1 Tax=Bacillus carboniphilus TaxID=86663 RepID=A0ABN0WQ51_9BACI